MNIRKILEYALQREHEGKAFFENNAERLSNAAATEAFKAIAAEEQRHIEFIQAQLDALDAKEPDKQAAPELDETEFFADRADKEMIEQTVNEAMVADLPVLRMAYLIERDFSEFYQQAASQFHSLLEHCWTCLRPLMSSGFQNPFGPLRQLGALHHLKHKKVTRSPYSPSFELLSHDFQSAKIRRL